MTLAVDSFLQQNSGATQGADAASVVVSLPAGATAGTTLIAAVMYYPQGGSLTLPSGWVQDAVANNTLQGALVVARKSGATGGETSWTFSTSGGASTQWAWYVGEVAGLDTNTSPLDASATATNSTTTASSFTRSTGTTGVNSGTDTLQLAFFGSQLGSPATLGTWAGYTQGFSEVAQVTAGGGSAMRYGLAAALNFSGGAALGPFESSATYTASGTGTTSVCAVVAYRAEDSPLVAPLTFACGFEHGTPYGAAPGFSGVPQVFSPITTTTPGTDYLVQAASARSAPSAYGCRLVMSNKAVRVAAVGTTFIPSNSGAVSVGWDCRVVSASGTVIVAEVGQGASSVLQVIYDSAASRYGLRWTASGATAWQAGTTALGTWAWIDLRVSGLGTSTWHADWRLETAGTYTPQASPTDLTGQSTVSVGGVYWGTMATVQTTTIDIDNLVLAPYYGVYPLGPHQIQAVKVDPTGTPTANGTVGNFALVTNNTTGATLTSGTLTSARDAIDDLPPVISASSDGVVQATAAATDYLQFPMDTIAADPSRVIASVRMIAALISTVGNGSGNLGIRGWDGARETTLMALTAVTPGSSTVPGNTAPPFVAYTWNPQGGWTQAKLDAAALRLGFSGDATPDMGVHALYLEVATRPAITVRQASVEDNTFTVDLTLSPYSSASVSYGLTSTHGTRGATFSYSLAGIPQAPVYVPPASTATVTIGAEAFGDVSDVTFTPDATT